MYLRDLPILRRAEQTMGMPATTRQAWTRAEVLALIDASWVSIAATGSDAWAVELGERLLEHASLRNLLPRVSAAPRPLDELAAELSRAVPAFKPMPILINEDDHENFDQPANNFSVAISEHVSWGWFDYRRKGEAMEEGYQSPPVNWGISSARKRAFFNLLAEITASKKP